MPRAYLDGNAQSIPDFTPSLTKFFRRGRIRGRQVGDSCEEIVAPPGDCKLVKTLPQDAGSGLPFPTTTLRLGFAGTRELTDPSSLIAGAITRIFDTVERSLGSHLAAAAFVKDHLASTATPRLRLLSGLAEGADRLACDLFLARNSPTVHRELGAILPFDRATYRSSRDATHHASFDRLVQACEYVVELDGRYAPGPEHHSQRARGYRAQSRILLRQVDLLIAVANPTLPERPGGTLETIRMALEFGVPVLLVHASTGRVRWLDPAEDPANVWLEADSDDERIPDRDLAGTSLDPQAKLSATSTAADDSATSVWQTNLQKFINELTPPSTQEGPSQNARHAGHPAHHHDVIEEYFTHLTTPPRTNDGRVHHGLRARVWLAFSRWFAAPQRPSAPPTMPSSVAPRIPARVVNFRQRARDLSEYYTSLYRGAFLTNYLLAVCAVTLAAACLVLLGEQHTVTAKKLTKTLELSSQMIPLSPSSESTSAESTSSESASTGSPPTTTPHNHDATAAEPLHGPSHPSTPWLDRTILALTGLKLLIVLVIFANTHQANHAGWSERGVDYRYLAERLRAIQYLPLVGSYQPPAPTPPQFATRAMRQSDVDWLFRAMVRTMSPSDTDSPRTAPGPVSTTIDPLAAMQAIETQWVDVQAEYHARNSATLSRIASFTESLGKSLNCIVILVVAIDITILVSSFVPWNALHILHSLHGYAPWLVFLAAVLPAVVASLNGIRFQSECQRLSDRSRVVSRILSNHSRDAAQLRQRIERARANPDTDPGAWILPALSLAERCAHDLIEEVGEWSVLYAKEISEP